MATNRFYVWAVVATRVGNPIPIVFSETIFHDEHSHLSGVYEDLEEALQAAAGSTRMEFERSGGPNNGHRLYSVVVPMQVWKDGETRQETQPQS